MKLQIRNMKTVIAFGLFLASQLVVFTHAAETQPPTNPPPATVTLHDFNLVGDLRDDRA